MTKPSEDIQVLDLGQGKHWRKSEPDENKIYNEWVQEQRLKLFKDYAAKGNGVLGTKDKSDVFRIVDTKKSEKKKGDARVHARGFKCNDSKIPVLIQVLWDIGYKKDEILKENKKKTEDVLQNIRVVS